jgi:nitroreductase
MDLETAIRGRRSVRKFTSEKPDISILRELVEFATLAPNAMNKQDWHFTIITSNAMREKIAATVKSKWEKLLNKGSGVDDMLVEYSGNFSIFLNAPALIVVDSRRPPAFLDHMLKDDTSRAIGAYASACMAVENMLLAAYDKGLGTCVYTGCLAAAIELAELIGIPRQRELVCLVAIGYPAETPPAPPRKSLDMVMTTIE